MKIDPTPEQMERANKLNQITLELLNIDTKMADRQEHISIACALLSAHTQSTALVAEIVGDENVGDMRHNFIYEAVQYAIDAHLRVAEALPRNDQPRWVPDPDNWKLR